MRFSYILGIDNFWEYEIIQPEGNRIGGIQPYGEKAGATPTYFPIKNGSLETLDIGVFFVMWSFNYLESCTINVVELYSLITVVIHFY